MILGEDEERSKIVLFRKYEKCHGGEKRKRENMRVSEIRYSHVNLANLDCIDMPE